MPPTPPTLDDRPVIPYTIFTRRERIILTYLLGFTSLASSLTATIYFPLIPLLSAHYRVSTQAINLTITLYVVFQALSPAVFATISDSLGRRPVFLAIFTIYAAASLGLALNESSYAALLILRALQSIGGSAVMAISYGVVADVAISAERGKMLGPMLAATNLGPCIGPVVGGWVAFRSGGFMWCFWALVIFAGLALMAIGFAMLETARSVVGNGSVPARGLWRTWWDVIVGWIHRLRRGNDCPSVTTDRNSRENRVAIDRTGDEQNAGKTGKGTLKIPNSFACLRILFRRDSSLILWMAASPYAVWYCIQISIPLIYSTTYGFNELEVGLCFLTGGFGVIFGGIATGKLMDWNYNVTAREIGHTVDRVSGDDMNHFPIEKARSRGSLYFLGFSICALAGYGWATERHVHSSVPLILQFLIGAKCTILLQVYSTLLIDIFPENPSTAAASGNITRCALSAAAVAIIEPLVGAVGRGWFFTLVGLIDGVGSMAAVLAIRKFGARWRIGRAAEIGNMGPVAANVPRFGHLWKVPFSARKGVAKNVKNDIG
ncbi:hypothetical protein FGG08_006361 [Glutinoglossum americanum]|uniref:Major facilitator superfamily (MFS) profile domain-containing protein n=1 Tax=Glutinoglossum americanum TaxID=1670608 RepID=A0A9P8L0G4_9PEZI|nr:hypothetical protein FGG08_006361 [Glutinoglossum americanum]